MPVDRDPLATTNAKGESNMNPTGQVALITGASTGFGNLTARTLARCGHQVYAGMRDVGDGGRNAERRAALLDWAGEQGAALSVVELDVTDDASVAAAVEQTVADGGRIDVLVNNAGIAWMGVTEAFTVAQAREMFETNVFGVHRMNRAVLPHMRRRRRGLVIHVSSTLGRFVMPFLGLYNSSKWALEALAETLRYEISGLGIESVIVEPGAFPTEIGNRMRGPADDDRVPEYGEVLEVQQQIGAAMGTLLGGDDAPDPQAVADAIRDLVELPAGQRPVRTPVGADAQVLGAINATSVELQREVLEGFDIGRVLSASVGERS